MERGPRRAWSSAWAARSAPRPPPAEAPVTVRVFKLAPPATPDAAWTEAVLCVVGSGCLEKAAVGYPSTRVVMGNNRMLVGATVDPSSLFALTPPAAHRAKHGPPHCCPPSPATVRFQRSDGRTGWPSLWHHSLRRRLVRR